MRSMGRLRMVERRLGINLPCAMCEGRGKSWILVAQGVHDVVEPVGCAHCGKIGQGLKIILEPEAAGAGARS